MSLNSIVAPEVHMNSSPMFTQVTESLFLSDYTSITESTLMANQISLVINCTPDMEHVTFPSLSSVKYTRVRIWDTPAEDLQKHLNSVCDQIHKVGQNGGHTLVHCVKGISRSVSFCLAYLVKYKNMTLRQAFSSLQAKRAIVHPNPGFWRQLIEFEKQLTGVATVKMLVYPQGAKPDVSQKELSSSKPRIGFKGFSLPWGPSQK